MCIISGGDIVKPYVSYLSQLNEILKMDRFQNHITIQLCIVKIEPILLKNKRETLGENQSSNEK